MFWSAYSGVGVGLFSAVLIILDKPWHHLPDWKIATSIYPIWLGAGFLMLGYLTAGAPGVEWMMTPWYRYTPLSDRHITISGVDMVPLNQCPKIPPLLCQCIRSINIAYHTYFPLWGKHAYR